MVPPEHEPDGAWLETLPLDACVPLLREHTVGRIAVEDASGPVILPVNYRLVESPRGPWIAIRTRPGNVIDRSSARVAFEIDAIQPGLREGWSVLVRGTIHHVDQVAAKFAERFDPEPWIREQRDAWLIIDPFTISGRRLHAAEREWAYQVDAYL
jgi:nitroimidazol reductase NimA-like FMN-containing flavoprotein (pyridoxamine 5'-phosphate oxidase superfamily)